MKILYTTEEFNQAKSRDLIVLKCEKCNKDFNKSKHYVQANLKNDGGKYCSRKCANDAIAKSNIGKKHSEETKRKISESHKGEKSMWYGQTGEDRCNAKRVICITNKKVFCSLKKKML